MKSKYAILEALFITILITTTALISAGVAYKWKYGESYTVVLTAEVEAYRTDKADEVSWEAGIHDRPEIEGVECVCMYRGFYIIVNGTNAADSYEHGWLPAPDGFNYDCDGHIHREADYPYAKGYVKKAVTYMIGKTKNYGYEGDLTVSTSP